MNKNEFKAEMCIYKLDKIAIKNSNMYFEMILDKANIERKLAVLEKDVDEKSNQENFDSHLALIVEKRKTKLKLKYYIANYGDKEEILNLQESIAQMEFDYYDGKIEELPVEKIKEIESLLKIKRMLMARNRCGWEAQNCRLDIIYDATCLANGGKFGIEINNAESVIRNQNIEKNKKRLARMERIEEKTIALLANFSKENISCEKDNQDCRQPGNNNLLYMIKK